MRAAAKYQGESEVQRSHVNLSTRLSKATLNYIVPCVQLPPQSTGCLATHASTDCSLPGVDSGNHNQEFVGLRSLHREVYLRMIREHRFKSATHPSNPSSDSIFSGRYGVASDEDGPTGLYHVSHKQHPRSGDHCVQVKCELSSIGLRYDMLLIAPQGALLDTMDSDIPICAIHNTEHTPKLPFVC